MAFIPTYIDIYGVRKFFDTVLHEWFVFHDASCWNATDASRLVL